MNKVERELTMADTTTNMTARALVLLAGADPAVAAASAFRLQRLGGLCAIFIYHTAEWAAKAATSSFWPYPT